MSLSPKKHGVGVDRIADAPDFVVIDVETACSRVSSICQIGIVGFRDGGIAFEYETLVDPQDQFSSFNTRIHGITAEHVRGKPSFADVHDVVTRHLGGRITVAHSYFDKGAMAAACRVHDRTMVDTTWLDSVGVAKRAWPDLPSHKLNIVSRHLGIPLKHHDALSDARAAGMIVVKAIEHTGVPLADWMAPPVRSRIPAAPPPAATGPLAGERVAILGQPRNGPLARRIAASGGRVMSGVGTTTTILVVTGDEPFGYIRFDAHYRKAEALRQSGGAIRILSERQLLDFLGT
ncbi:transposase [Sphingomonas sp. Leaf407]|uniref:exonuclease domain-containing protein n=1 Tax=unclassified Sphingomonas TaxID=196159 RepID=UPI0006F21908|nr:MULTISPECIES: exonuclease domain-containing protein [unclassified Sphingomonas]KQN36939.1 transposase [Sphingomonas sp. Leaf42]KQT30366.1 transposase [Sphingomonas sp. Leaf407]